jgi:hypothetical protein
MRKKLQLGYIIILAFVGIIATQPALPQSKPKPALPEIYLAWCEYDIHGNVIRYWCTEYGLIECKLTNCE